MSDLFTFTDAKGKSHELPPITIGRAKMTGLDLRDATIAGEVGQIGYMFKVLEAAGPSKDALDALYSMPQSEVLDVLDAWGDHGDGDGASLGESSGSSI
jgi:hypothetical protein